MDFNKTGYSAVPKYDPFSGHANESTGNKEQLPKDEAHQEAEHDISTPPPSPPSLPLPPLPPLPPLLPLPPLPPQAQQGLETPSPFSGYQNAHPHPQQPQPLNNYPRQHLPPQNVAYQLPDKLPSRLAGGRLANGIDRNPGVFEKFDSSQNFPAQNNQVAQPNQPNQLSELSELSELSHQLNQLSQLNQPVSRLTNPHAPGTFLWRGFEGNKASEAHHAGTQFNNRQDLPQQNSFIQGVSLYPSGRAVANEYNGVQFVSQKIEPVHVRNINNHIHVPPEELSLISQASLPFIPNVYKPEEYSGTWGNNATADRNGWEKMTSRMVLEERPLSMEAVKYWERVKEDPGFKYFNENKIRHIETASSPFGFESGVDDFYLKRDMGGDLLAVSQEVCDKQGAVHRNNIQEYIFSVDDAPGKCILPDLYVLLGDYRAPSARDLYVRSMREDMNLIQEKIALGWRGRVVPSYTLQAHGTYIDTGVESPRADYRGKALIHYYSIKFQ